MKSFILLILAASAALPQTSVARGSAEHVVVVVWDGMRPDFITPQYTPVLFELASRGTFFLHHHSAFVSSTEVNGTVLATGMQPDHSGIMANIQYRPDVSWLNSYGTESLDAVRRGDTLSEGHYLAVPTISEQLQAAGFPTAVAGAKPIALLHDRAPRKTTPAEKDSVTLFRGQTLPRSVLESLVRSREIGPFPGGALGNPAGPGAGSRRSALAASTNAVEAATATATATATNRLASAVDNWTTKALIHGLWKKSVPKYSLLWLSEPDAAQHTSGPGSENAIAALESSDANLGLVLKALEDKGVLDQTDIFVVSDHGFSTIQRGPDIIESLKRSKFTAGTQFQNPEAGDIMVVNLGGSVSFYVFDHDEAAIRRLVAYLQATDWAGVIFSQLTVEGTFPLSQAHVAATAGAPDVLVSMRWNGELNEFGVPGMLASIEGKAGHGTHASLSPFDLHNTLVAAGPDLKRGFVSELPSGNIDLAPTILYLLDVPPPGPLDGRVLAEALVSVEPPPGKPLVKTVEAARDLGFLTWHQQLRFTQLGSAIYYDEGNGASSLKGGSSDHGYTSVR